MTATTPFSGLRPVANAFGIGSGMRNTRGFGIPARWESSSTIACSPRRLLARQLVRAVHREHDPVGEEVRPDVHRERERERSVQIAVAERAADRDEQRREHPEQQKRLQLVLHDETSWTLGN